MDANETVRRLILGSQNLDKMRAEINLLTSTLGGLICRCSGFYETQYWVPTSQGYWIIQKKGSQCDFWYGNFDTAYLSSSQTVNMSCVEDVYKSLPELVKGLFGHLEKLEKLCKPLISASYVFETPA